MKYIIDVPNQDYSYDKILHTLKLKFYDDNLSCEVLLDAEPYTEPDRKAIEDEVWELARRIICPSDCCVDSISAHTKEIFNKEGWEIRGIFNDLSYQEAKSKYEAWLKQKDEIHVGNEVLPSDTEFDTMVVTRLWKDDYDSDCVDTIGYDGRIYSFLKNRVLKTGRHFPEVAQLLEKMRRKKNDSD